ncbi:anaphase-promoting complex subunit 5 isoform X1 [Pieris brassicae]|uniref:Anaphase-promoting complex subunit 5 n=2 Tax=Pieris brassicae TaxID=7116 RepID=A0A9P0X6Y7_PIEBR|nr:anaphase-promoting complex subunit 5 isoform X1 [Pieris brassicae]CAH4003314.1 unnamed protein product [Pieris brassicae]
MDSGAENLDFGKLVNVKGNVDNITPHKIAVVAFIREYGLLKIEAREMSERTIAPKYRKDFCILALKLIQCPDMEFKELEALLTDGRYNLLSVHLQNFCVRLQNIYINGINALMDCVTSTLKMLMIEQSEVKPSIVNRCSVIGFYLRRIALHLDKLTFVQLGTLYKSFCQYYQKGRPGLMMRSLSKEKLHNIDSQASTSMNDESRPQEIISKLIADKDNNFEECQWSRKQAELFTAQQANLLQINPKMALPPKQLQKMTMQIIHDIPEYPDVHFLSFLNCLRMKEFCGAQESLYNCFDRPVFSIGNGSDKNKNFRFAALNRAAMHVQFDHKPLAMEGVREALAKAQEAGDSACMSHAAAWGALAGGRARRAALLSRMPRAPRAAAAAAQFMALHAALNSVKPCEVFQIISKGDSLNYMHSLTDLTMAALANTAALWGLYGKTEMASINCQLLLNLNTKCKIGTGAAWQWGDTSATAGAGAVGVAAWRGHVAIATALASHFTTPPARALNLRHHATFALRAGKWEEAEQSIRELASFDRWESQLLKAEMYFLKGDPTNSLETLQDVLENCKTEDDSQHYIPLRLKAMILESEVEHSFSSVQSINIILLNEALTIARLSHLHYLAACIEMHIANLQLHMGCSKKALLLARKVLPTIMEHGSAYDVARGMLLYTKCRIATVSPAGDARQQVLQSCCESLDIVKENFSKVGAQNRVLQTWYLQARLFHDIGNIAARNQCAWMFRQLESQLPLDTLQMSHIVF